MLKDKAILVEKKVKIPSGTKRDLRLTGQLAHTYGGNSKAKVGNYNKEVVNSDYLKPFRNIRNQLNVYVDDWTLPWLAGLDLLPSKQLLDFSAFFREKKSEWDDCFEKLSEQYPDEIKREARVRMTNPSTGDSRYDERDYLPKEIFLDKFSMKMRFIPVSDADDLDLRVHIGEQEAESIKRQVRADMEQELRDTHTDLCLRIKEHVTHMRDILSSDSPRIFDTMVDGVRQLADTIPALNFMDDPKLNELAEDIRIGLNANTILLRDSEYEREVVTNKAEDILRKLGTIYAS